jgi:DNA-binding transcriptional LysR family regulator
MSVAQLEYFVAVAEERHLTRAAERLHMSQPPLTRQIRNLEDELGTRLFTRSPRGMQLLPPGEVFLQEARAILARLQALPKLVRGQEALPPPGAIVPIAATPAPPGE